MRKILIIVLALYACALRWDSQEKEMNANRPIKLKKPMWLLKEQSF